MPAPLVHDPTLVEPNAENRYEVTRADVPLACPMPGMYLWNSHPRVYLPIEKTGFAKCPYCGAEYALREGASGAQQAGETIPRR